MRTFLTAALALKAAAALALAIALPAMAPAAGIDNDGTYRTHDADRRPADIVDTVRIIPPPTGGNMLVRVRPDRARYHIGDPLRISFGVNRDAHVFIFDTDAAGVSRLIFPNYYDTDNFLRAGKSYYIPDRGYQMEVAGPAGNETLTAIAVGDPYPLLGEYRTFSKDDPYPAWREGAAGMIRRIETHRREPSGMEMRPLRPVPKENLYSTDDTTFYVMGSGIDTYRPARYGKLDLDTYPNNARIYIDGQYFGRTPQVIDRLAVGTHSLRLTKEGYLPFEGNFFTKGNETKSLDLFLRETPPDPGFSRSAKPPGPGGLGFLLPCPPE